MTRCLTARFTSGLLMLVLGSGIAQAGDPVRGKEQSATCIACHGESGNSPVTTFPKIAGQHEDYLLQSLKAYRDKSRTNPIMAAIIVPLSETDMEDLAAYYASQSGLYPIDAGRLKDVPGGVAE